MNTPSFRFLQHYVTNGTTKVKVSYSIDNRHDKRKCVTLYAADYGSPLFRLFKDVEGIKVENASDSMTDYFEHDHMSIFEGHPLKAGGGCPSGAERSAPSPAPHAGRVARTEPNPHGVRGCVRR